MTNPVSSQNGPYKAKVEKDKTYFWCSCGLSKKQPFCDNSHNKEVHFKPIKYVAKSDKEVCNKFSAKIDLYSSTNTSVEP